MEERAMGYDEIDLGEWDELDMDAIEEAVEKRLTEAIFPVTTMLWEGRR
jgi:hypothetical protein